MIWEADLRKLKDDWCLDLDPTDLEDIKRKLDMLEEAGE